MKSTIDGCDAQINLISDKLNTGSEFREIPCEIEYDFENKLKRWIREDTGEIAKEDIIPYNELQEEMDIATEAREKQEAEDAVLNDNPESDGDVSDDGNPQGDEPDQTPSDGDPESTGNESTEE